MTSILHRRSVALTVVGNYSVSDKCHISGIIASMLGNRKKKMNE